MVAVKSRGKALLFFVGFGVTLHAFCHDSPASYGGGECEGSPPLLECGYIWYNRGI